MSVEKMNAGAEILKKYDKTAKRYKSEARGVVIKGKFGALTEKSSARDKEALVKLGWSPGIHRWFYRDA